MRKKLFRGLAILLCLSIVLCFSACGEKGEKGAPGVQGEAGVGITSIEKTGTEGLVDTYTVTYSDGSTFVFTVTNGAQGIQGIRGEQGEDGTNGKDGKDGKKGDLSIITIQNGYWYIDGVNTNQQAVGLKGETGNGVSGISKTATNGLVDTYTITFTNGTTTTFTVTNGAVGEQGPQGLQGIQGIQGIQGEKGADGHTPVITIQNGYWYIDGVNTTQSALGIQGETGNGISDISKTATNGLVDTYTITFTNGTTTTFTVTNGAQGQQGIQGIQGEKGADGHTPVITIQNGYWYIDGVNTTQSALGIQGETGNGISDISKTATNGLVDTYTITFTNGTTTTFTVTNGAQGQQGIQGVGVANAYVNGDLHLILVLTNGVEIDAGYVGVVIQPSEPSDPVVPGNQPTVAVAAVQAASGQTGVTVAVSVQNNPGILGMVLSLTYDEDVLTLKSMKKGTALEYLSLTKPGILASGCNITLDGLEVDPESAMNGDVVVLTFDVAAGAPSGSYAITLTQVGNIVDNDLQIVDINLVNGAVEVTN